MRYLAVDNDGTEWIFNYEVERHYGEATSESEQLVCFDDVENKKCNFWTMKNKIGYDFPKHGKYANRIELPKGSIFKLVDKTLTWEDEPVQF